MLDQIVLKIKKKQMSFMLINLASMYLKIENIYLKNTMIVQYYVTFSLTHSGGSCLELLT